MATSAGFPPGALAFLRGIAAHNDKTWFDAHRDDYERDLLEPAKDFVVDVGTGLRAVSKRVKFEPRINGSISRLNRDLRFSKDKRPYKEHFAFWLWEGPSKKEGPGYWLSLTPTTFYAGAGAHMFDPKSLARYRKAVDDPRRGAALSKITSSLEKAHYQIGGAKLKRVPAPYPQDHPRAELLKHQGLYAGTELPMSASAVGRGLAERVVARLRSVAPLEEWLLSL